MNRDRIQDKRTREKKVVGLMIRLYCSGNHGTKRGELCGECRELSEYAAARVDHCPHMETKTFCSNCRTHCYKPEMREKIRKVMRWSGPRMIFYHPVLAVRHVIEMKKEQRAVRQAADGQDKCEQSRRWEQSRKYRNESEPYE